MEKKTIGQFIAVLRKANGMTQQEVADRLNVSNKAVSRWERDECAPDLSLIPAIAEMFEVTCDELLRGERLNSDREYDAAEDPYSKQKSKSDKIFKKLMYNLLKKYKNLTLISLGITVIGLISAAVANLAFSEGLIAFCITLAFVVTSEICQICFASNAHLPEDDELYGDEVKILNTRIIRLVVSVSFFNIFVLSFCLPLVTLIDGRNFGLIFDSWIMYGLLTGSIVITVVYVLYRLIIHKCLCEHNVITLTSDEVKKNSADVRLLKRILLVSGCIAWVICVGIFILNNISFSRFIKKLEFENCEDFKNFVESEYDEWLNEGYSYYDKNGNKIIPLPIVDGKEHYPDKVYEEITNLNGEVICEYYINPNLYAEISFTDSSYDKTPITVIRRDARYDAMNTFNTIESALYWMLAIDFIIAVAVYVIKRYRINKTKMD